MKYTLYIGLNDKDTKAQETRTEDALLLVSVYCAEVFGGATISTARGVYTHESGSLVTENTIRCELFTENENAVKTAVFAFKEALNQESIGVTKEAVNLLFA